MSALSASNYVAEHVTLVSIKVGCMLCMRSAGISFHVLQVITVLRKMLAAEMRAKSSNNAELNPQKPALPSA